MLVNWREFHHVKRRPNTDISGRKFGVGVCLLNVFFLAINIAIWMGAVGAVVDG